MKYRLCPSILSADFNRLGEQMQIMEREGIEWVHIDVMDGDFVPSISFGMPVIESIRKESGLFFDVHLMVREPIRYIDKFVSCGADSLTVHTEACKDLEATLLKIREAGIKAGVSIKPDTPVEAILPVLDLVDMVLVMTVEPGFGGQKYIDSCTGKIEQVRALARERGRELDIQVDGGIYDETLPIALGAGANLFVAGSWAFKGDLAANIAHIEGRILELIS